MLHKPPKSLIIISLNICRELIRYQLGNIFLNLGKLYRVKTGKLGN
jgi:hypothetical protein